jgi:6,7-dimethyl-8-ribityllumazine synthase
MRRSPEKGYTPAAHLDRKLAARARVAVIRAEYNREITLSLEKKCLEALRKAGVRAENLDAFSVPGCFEIPLMARRLAELGRYHAMIALGAVIRGETHHFELVAGECARGVMQVSLQYNVPIIFEVLATYNRRDALRRAGNNHFNKGQEAAESALALLATFARLKGRNHVRILKR